MIKLDTPFGSAYLLKPEKVIYVGSRRVSPKFSTVTREVVLEGGRVVWIADTESNMHALVPGYEPEAPIKPIKAKKRYKRVPVED